MAKDIDYKDSIKNILCLFIIAAVGVFMFNLSWQRWPDIFIDFGRELYVAWQIKNGPLIIYFDTNTGKALPTKEEREDEFKMPVLLQLQDGTVYGTREHEMASEQGAAPDGGPLRSILTDELGRNH